MNNEWCEPICNCSMCKMFDETPAKAELIAEGFISCNIDWSSTLEYISKL